MSDTPTVWHSLRKALTPARGADQPTTFEAAGVGLPPLSREILEQLPDPLMLTDRDGRVLFANRAMRTVVGVDTERKHVSAWLRTPAVLESIEKTAATGEPTMAEFTTPVPVARHYQAYVTRTASEPAVVTLLLHDLTTA